MKHTIKLKGFSHVELTGFWAWVFNINAFIWFCVVLGDVIKWLLNI